MLRTTDKSLFIILSVMLRTTDKSLFNIASNPVNGIIARARVGLVVVRFRMTFEFSM